MAECRSQIPCWPEGDAIPRIIHQTFATRRLPDEVQPAIAKVKADHPGWEYRFYDDADIERFIGETYGAEILAKYHRLNPDYGAARADLFRYLLIYKVGGAYLDIKSSSLRPLDEAVAGQRYLLANWDNGPQGTHPNWGLHDEIKGLNRGELQQWHVIAAPGHPFLRAVIERVLRGIDQYRPWLHEIGKAGVFGLTGPIAYTEAITPLLPHHSYRLHHDERELGLRYSALAQDAHHALGGPHYTQKLTPVVCQRGIRRPLAFGYTAYRTMRSRLREITSRR